MTIRIEVFTPACNYPGCDAAVNAETGESMGECRSVMALHEADPDTLSEDTDFQEEAESKGCILEREMWGLYFMAKCLVREANISANVMKAVTGLEELPPRGIFISGRNQRPELSDPAENFLPIPPQIQ